jgi:hypothetical protein
VELTRAISSAIPFFLRMLKPRTTLDGNGKYLVAKSEDGIIQRLHDGWRVVQALNHDKYLFERA